MNPRKYGKIKRFLFSPIVLFVMAIIAGLVLYSGISLFIKRNDAWAKARNAQAEESELVAKKESLQKRLNSLETGEGVEAAIREKYHLAKEGENIIIITDSSRKPEIEEKKNTVWQNFKQRISTIFK